MLLFTGRNSICTQKVLMTLFEKNLPFETKRVDLFKNEQYNPEYLKINPKGVVPSLVAWLAVFHVADAAQTIAAFVLRAYKIVTVPVLVYVAALWGVGLGGGFQLAFNVPGTVPTALHGAPGFWIAATAGLVLAGAALGAFMLWMMRRQRHEEAAARDQAGRRGTGSAGPLADGSGAKQEPFAGLGG